MKQALGIIEARGIATLVHAADAMLKAAPVQFSSWRNTDGEFYALFVNGEIEAVIKAVEAGKSAAKLHGADAVRVHVIPQPHGKLEETLQKIGMIRQNDPAKIADPNTEIPPGDMEQAIKEEICSVGRKLWQRSYVDGNGGNISYRIGENAVLCTPTLLSKADLTPDDLCLVDLDGNQLAGPLSRTSEIFLHLEIYKKVPQAKAVVHCHPPHATAYAISGCVPPPTIIPEFDVFVGSVAITPYETPGTKKFAETVLPFIQNHNTVLLGNHGIVCWADTPTHAEWYAENLETYCQTLLISRLLGVPYVRIPPEKEQDLLAVKKRLGLPDARFESEGAEGTGIPSRPGEIALAPSGTSEGAAPSVRTLGDADVEAIAKAAAQAVLAGIKHK